MAFDSALTAWSTLALALLAAVTAGFAYLAWRGQRSELTMLITDRKREAQERRERYVNRVYALEKFENIDVSPEGTGERYATVKSVELRNVGEMPIYDITFAWYVNCRLRHQQSWVLTITKFPA